MPPPVASKGQLSFIVVIVVCVSASACFSFVRHFRAMKAGMQRPLLVSPPHKDYNNSTLVAALGALHALYMVRHLLLNVVLWSSRHILN